MSETNNVNIAELSLNQIAFLKLGLKEGDTVKVVAKVPEGTHGSDIYWETSMTRKIGKTQRVVGARNHSRIELEDGYYYPALALEKVKVVKEIRLPDYTALVSEDGVSVGCQNLTKEMVLGIVKAAVETNFISQEDLEF